MLRTTQIKRGLSLAGIAAFAMLAGTASAQLQRPKIDLGAQRGGDETSQTVAALGSPDMTEAGQELMRTPAVWGDCIRNPHDWLRKHRFPMAMVQGATIQISSPTSPEGIPFASMPSEGIVYGPTIEIKIIIIIKWPKGSLVAQRTYQEGGRPMNPNIKTLADAVNAMGSEEMGKAVDELSSNPGSWAGCFEDTTMWLRKRGIRLPDEAQAGATLSSRNGSSESQLASIDPGGAYKTPWRGTLTISVGPIDITIKWRS